MASLALGLASCSDELPPTRDRAKTSDRPQVETPGSSDLSLPGKPALLLEPSTGSGAIAEQRGEASVSVATASFQGGEVGTKDGLAGTRAFSFPEFRGRGPYPRAVVTATPTTEEDGLSPDSRDFQYGADIRLEAESTGRTEDNGNNVIQRGLSVDPVMFKLEVDANLRPSCTIKGRLGEVTVYALQPLEPSTWYRIRCDRQKDQVTIFVGEFLPSGATTAVGRGQIGKIGPVDMRDPLLPVSVGGKVSRSGQIVRDATDQFNGEIANPFLVFP